MPTRFEKQMRVTLQNCCTVEELKAAKRTRAMFGIEMGFTGRTPRSMPADCEWLQVDKEKNEGWERRRQ